MPRLLRTLLSLTTWSIQGINRGLSASRIQEQGRDGGSFQPTTNDHDPSALLKARFKGLFASDLSPKRARCKLVRTISSSPSLLTQKQCAPNIYLEAAGM
uniref:Uncharacterized protein n=1 Tax=Physcomitrium patens TaxID=3218 RepID=A0A7I4EVH9_PHYPA